MTFLNVTRRQLVGLFVGAAAPTVESAASLQAIQAEPHKSSATSPIYPETDAESTAAVTPTHLIYAPYDVRRYGADPTGATDSTTAFNACFRAAAAESRATAFGAPGASFKISGTLTIDTNRVGFDGLGCYLNCAGMTSGSLWNIVQSNASSFTRCSLNAAHPLVRFVAQGPGSGVPCKFVDFDDATGLAVIAGIQFRDGGSLDWQTHARYGVGAYFNSFNNWFFDSVLSGSNTFVDMPAANQSGERNSFNTCRFGISAHVGVNHNNANADTTFYNCSFNGNGTKAMRFITQTAGTIRLTDCHLESSTDGDYWISVTGAYSCMFVHGGQILLAAAKTSFPIFYCDASVTPGALQFGPFLLGSSFPFTQPLVGGAGSVVRYGQQSTYRSGSSPAYTAVSLNQLGDGSFESAILATDGWTTGGETPPMVSRKNPLTPGTRSVQFAGVSGQTNVLISRQFCCSPGQLFQGQGYIATTGFTAGTSFNATLSFLNAHGGSIGSGFPLFNAITNNRAYERTSFTGNVFAPAGTVSLQISFWIGGTTSGTPFAYLDDLVINIG